MERSLTAAQVARVTGVFRALSEHLGPQSRHRPASSSTTRTRRHPPAHGRDRPLRLLRPRAVLRPLGLRAAIDMGELRTLLRRVSVPDRVLVLRGARAGLGRHDGAFRRLPPPPATPTGSPWARPRPASSPTPWTATARCQATTPSPSPTSRGALGSSSGRMPQRLLTETARRGTLTSRQTVTSPTRLTLMPIPANIAAFAIRALSAVSASGA